MEPPSERLEYESDPEDTEDTEETEEGDKTESRTTIAIKVFAPDKYEGRFQGPSMDVSQVSIIVSIKCARQFSTFEKCHRKKKDPHSLVLSIFTNKRKT